MAISSYPLGLGSLDASTLPPSGPAGGDLTGTYPNPTVTHLEDNGFTINNSSDATKQLQFNLSGSTASTILTIASSQTASRTLTVPVLGAADTVMTLGTTQTVTGVKTLALPLIADVTDTTKQIAFILSGQTASSVLSLASSQTASHTLTVPVLGGPDTIATLAVANTFTATNVIAAGTITSNAPCLQLTTTWNASGTTFSAPLQINVTNSASHAGSKFFDLQIGGNSYLSFQLGASSVTSPTIRLDGTNLILNSGNASQLYLNSDVNTQVNTGTGLFSVGGQINILTAKLNVTTSTANGSVACVLTATTGPTGSATGNVGWITILVGGVSHYMPYW